MNGDENPPGPECREQEAREAHVKGPLHPTCGRQRERERERELLRVQRFEVQQAGGERAPGAVQDGVFGTRGVLDVQDPQQPEALKDRRTGENKRWKYLTVHPQVTQPPPSFGHHLCHGGLRQSAVTGPRSL
ncbi:hypothetical protein EYF80_039351 [Liparis tanakae]|uniref:Uncharacterized protein n=1 Tax=Liparis tanakae TaxID=230148 RepID=A0A4Z2GBI5_9TELE|nr:hypothetical protein EYF80_039351 [Liparis tanakae]